VADPKKILPLLLKAYRAPKLELEYSSPLELLVAVILSAQCTDERVNAVTRNLFRKYQSARDYAEASLATLEREIRPTGFYKNKAKLIRRCGEMLVAEFDGQVPSKIDELIRLPGVGRKTANMVLGNAFGSRQGIAVDTHVLRVSNRLGLAASKIADKVERALMPQVPPAKWTAFSNAMILHGRRVCAARTPRCGSCVLYRECGWPEKSAHRDRTR
jgi:endonuclease-3